MTTTLKVPSPGGQRCDPWQEPKLADMIHYGSHSADRLRGAHKQTVSPRTEMQIVAMAGAMHAVEKRIRQLLLKRQFESLLSTWKRDRPPTSSTEKMAMHPAYQRIIGMGPDVLPFILGELEREPDWWFWALRAIAGADPVRPENRGNLRRMTEDWLDWARAKRIAW